MIFEGSEYKRRFKTRRNEAIQVKLKHKLFLCIWDGGGKKIPGVAKGCLETILVLFHFSHFFVETSWSVGFRYVAIDMGTRG